MIISTAVTPLSYGKPISGARSDFPAGCGIDRLRVDPDEARQGHVGVLAFGILAEGFPATGT